MRRAESQSSEPMTPVAYEVVRRWQELPDVFSFELAPKDGRAMPRFLPGQFNMLYTFGLGEVPISISSDPADSGRLIHTIRMVGAVTDGLAKLKARDYVGVRGPFGTSWPVDSAEGYDVLVVGGGLALAPLRPAIYQLLGQRERFGRCSILYGARTPKDILFRKELNQWKKSGDLDVLISVESGGSRWWKGAVGHATTLISRAKFRPERTVAFLCGPGDHDAIYGDGPRKARGCEGTDSPIHGASMKCAVGFCGHCQLGPDFICKDGPVLPYTRLEPLLRIREV